MTVIWHWQARIEANHRAHNETGTHAAPRTASIHDIRQAASRTLDQRHPDGYIIVGHINATPTR